MLSIVRIHSAVALAAAALLSACGGGGGGGSTPPAPSPSPTPVGCTAQVLTYDACSFNAPALASGATASVTTSTTGYSGSATASCTNGTLSLVATAASCQKSGPTDADLAIQTTVPALTYAADAPERLFVEYVNKQRAQCGFGLLAQSAALDRAAKAHTNYIMERALESDQALTDYDRNPHIEIPGKSGFTGATHVDRIGAAGYSNPPTTTESGATPAAGETTDGRVINSQGMAALSAMVLTGTVYHLRQLMGHYREVGVGQSWAAPIRQYRSSFGPTYATLGYKDYPQRANALRTYPCQGTENSEFSFGAETPDPLVGSGISYPVGQPIFFQAPRTATTFSIASVSIDPVNAPAGTPSYSSAANNVLILTQTNDPQRRLQASEAIAIPHKPLLASTSYRVRASLLIDGAVQSVDFTFQTGIGNFAEANKDKYLTPLAR
jgi:hypothetical protein